MHVERQRGRRTALPQRLISQGVTEEIESQAAVHGVDRQLQKPLGAQAVVVPDRMRRIAVMFARTRCEIGRQRQAALPQVFLPVGEAEIHGAGLLGEGSA